MRMLVFVSVVAALVAAGCGRGGEKSIHAVIGGGETVRPWGDLEVSIRRAECQAFPRPAEGEGEGTHEIAVTAWLQCDAKEGTRLTGPAGDQTVSGVIRFEAVTPRHLVVKSTHYTLSSESVPLSGEISVSTRITGLSPEEIDAVNHVQIHWD